MNEQKQTIHVEIDYDKLAKAIIKAQKEVKLAEQNNTNMRHELLKVTNGVFYVMIAGCSVWNAIHWWIGCELCKPVLGLSLEATKWFITASSFCLVSMMITIILSMKDETPEQTETRFNTHLAIIALVITFFSMYRGGC